MVVFEAAAAAPNDAQGSLIHKMIYLQTPFGPIRAITLSICVRHKMCVYSLQTLLLVVLVWRAVSCRGVGVGWVVSCGGEGLQGS